MIHGSIQLTGSLSVTGSLIIPHGPESDRTGTPKTGSMFLNTDTGNIENYNGETWVTQSAGSGGGGGGGNTFSGVSEYLVIAGGGGGGSYGGGGAGGYLSGSVTFTSGSTYQIVVGAGGSGTGNDYNNPGSNGTTSSLAGPDITTIDTVGGGGGGDNTGTTDAERGQDGGSGGGGSDGSSNPVTERVGGTATTGQGNDGGDGFFQSSPESYQGGGGGGAGAAGGDASHENGGDGGDGLPSNITGVAVTRGGGGGGTAYITGDTPGSAGSGGGGTGGAWGSDTTDQTGQTTGTANTGGGGGSGAAGGSGVVILSYPSSSMSANGGDKFTRTDGRVVHIFSSSGDFTVGNSGEYIIPSEHFNIVQYEGNGSSKTVSGVGFQPDFIWIKNLDDSTRDHQAWDVVRGGTNFLEISDNLAEFTNSTFVSTNSDGFSLNGNSGVLNDPETLAAWCWRAGGTAVSNTDGDITSNVSANTAAGFSIVTYTGTGAEETFGHGLNQTPELVMFKRRNTGANWFVTDGTQMGYLDLDSSFTTTRHNLHISSMGASTIGIKNVAGINGSSDTHVAYCWHSVPGFSKVGTYEGTGTSGNTVTLDFKPSFVLIKNIDDTGGWFVLDDVRDTDGTLNTYVFANTTAAQTTAASATVSPDYSGFEIGNTNSIHLNRSGDTFIYLAIA